MTSALGKEGAVKFEESQHFVQNVIVISVFYSLFPIQVKLFSKMFTNNALQVIVMQMDQMAKESNQVLVLFINITLVTLITTIVIDQDICFYNFSCLRPVLGVLPFNTVFSNISYIATGPNVPAFQCSQHVCMREENHLRPPLPHLRLVEKLEKEEGAQGVSTFGGQTWVRSRSKLKCTP